MNVLMLLSNPFTHDPRVYEEATTLIRAGHKVSVLAWDRNKKYPAIESKDGINVYRVYNTKFMNLLPFDIFRLHFWWRLGYNKAVKLHKKREFDVVHCHNLDTLPIGVKLKKKFGISLVYDAHEIWGYMVAKDLPKFWANYYLKTEKRLIKNIDGFIIAEDKYADYFGSFTDKKMVSILNCKHLFSNRYIEPEKKTLFSLIYIGTLTSARFLAELIDVIQGLDGVKLTIGGIGKKKFVNFLLEKCKNTKNVEFIGKVSPNKVIDMTLKSDAVVCMINPNVFNNQIATANKQFEAMVAGRPIICTKGTRSGEITKQERCGLVIDYTKEALHQAIARLRDAPDLCEELGKNALKAAITKYNWKIEEK